MNTSPEDQPRRSSPQEFSPEMLARRAASSLQQQQAAARQQSQQELIIPIKDHHHHHYHHHHHHHHQRLCRAIPGAQSRHSAAAAAAAAAAENSSPCSSSRSRANSSCRHRPQPAAGLKLPQAMYRITSQRRATSRRPKSSLLCIAGVLLLSGLLCTGPTEARFLFGSESAAGEPLPLAAALFGSPGSPLEPAGDSPSSIADKQSEPATGSGSQSDNPLLGALSKAVSAAVSAAASTQQQQQQQQPAPSSSSSAASQSQSSAPSASAPASAPGSGASTGSGSGSSVANALVSSISSAVASAAVSAAQSALSGGDGRTGVAGSGSSTGSGNRNHAAMRLALKIAADAIPEVPYNILHNMKKLDHAAPFYNVGKKSSHLGSSKESTSLLASALSSASHGRFGGAASILKSPIWKRIADGYGDFTSEFRSLFRPTPNTMKGPTGGSTSPGKLLRDISVPALLMLIAAAMPSEWRPVRNRRKLLQLPSIADLPQALIDPMSTSGSEQVSSLSAIPFMNAAVSSPSLSNLLQSSSSPVSRYQQIQPRELLPGGQQQAASGFYSQLMAANPQSRSGDINLAGESAANGFIGGQWEQPQQQQQQQHSISGGQQVSHPVSGQHLLLAAGGANQMQQASRRAGELALPTPLALIPAQAAREQEPANQKPVKRVANQLSRALSYMPPLLFLTSSLGSQAKGAADSTKGHLVRRVLEAGAGLVAKNRMVSSMASGEAGGSEQALSKREDHHQQQRLTDRHRYSMIDAEGGDQEERNAAPAKPFSLAAVGQALNSALESGLSGFSQNLQLASGAAAQHSTSIKNNKVEMLAADKLAPNRKEEQVRRSSGVAEQRQLGQLIPQAWKDVIKRTVSSVQQQASTQWRSIEGQFTNWVQDKLKPPSSGPTSTSASSPSSTTTTTTNAQGPAPISNIIASVSSSAMNMLGFGNKSSSESSFSTSGATDNSSSSSSSSSDGPKNKNDSPATTTSTNKQGNPAKSAFAGITNMIASVFTGNRQSATTPAPGGKQAPATGAADTPKSSASPATDTSTTKPAAAAAAAA